jgi:hypothetical protein
MLKKRHKAYRIQNDLKEGVRSSLNSISFKIYNGKIIDLLSTQQPDQSPIIRHQRGRHPRGGEVYLEGPEIRTVKTATDLLDVMEVGLRNRHQAKTKMNESSSRSHAVFTIFIQRRSTGAEV